MSDMIAHRGPDDDGVFSEPEHGIGLGHRRLSILDLSPAGAQPMASASGRYVAVYNGEIYNHIALREVLLAEGRMFDWRGSSDTETLLACIDAWGIERALSAAHGMFALAIWDRQERRLMLARDRIGEKPLYFGRVGNSVVFASELKALGPFPGFDGAVDEESVELFLRLSFVPAPRSIYRHINKLMPGHIATFEALATDPRIEPYWSIDDIISRTGADRRSGHGFDENVAQLDAVLGDVVQSQMISDVPLGAFLSGGIDSSLITALMVEKSARPVRTFSIGFGDSSYSEAQHAARIAQHLGTEHTELTVTEQDALDLIPLLSTIYDEPFADPSLFPTILLARRTREHVTVALSGDGGDEMFGGYNRHIFAPKLWRKAQFLPYPLRRIAGPLSAGVERFFTSDSAAFRRAAARFSIPLTTFEKLARFGNAFGSSRSFFELYLNLLETGDNFGRGRDSMGLDTLDTPGDKRELCFAEQLMRWDTLGYLPDDIMAKVDRSAMAHSLETRAPFLDARLIEQAWKFPADQRIGCHGGKSPLKELLYRRFPRDMIDRPKQGFAIPLDDWFRGPLSEWARTRIASFRDHAVLEGFAEDAERAWVAHAKGKRNNGNTLLNAAVLAEWVAHAGPASLASVRKAA